MYILLPSMILLGCTTIATITSQTIEIPETCLTPEEVALYNALNSYRESKGLSAIPLSKSLTLVAQLHCRDLAINKPNSRSGCNMHSWSGNGQWSSCCYTSNHANASCMWNKPRELTSYTSEGFEIAFYSTYTYNGPEDFANDAIGSWKESAGHNDVMINGSKWNNIQWKAVGVGVFGGYATIWFGTEPDPDKTTLTPCL